MSKIRHIFHFSLHPTTFEQKSINAELCENIYIGFDSGNMGLLLQRRVNHILQMFGNKNIYFRIIIQITKK